MSGLSGICTRIALHQLQPVKEQQKRDINVGLHQGSALNHFLLIVILEIISEKIDKETPWAMLFAERPSYLR